MEDKNFCYKTLTGDPLFIPTYPDLRTFRDFLLPTPCWVHSWIAELPPYIDCNLWTKPIIIWLWGYYGHNQHPLTIFTTLGLTVSECWTNFQRWKQDIYSFATAVLYNTCPSNLFNLSTELVNFFLQADHQTIGAGVDKVRSCCLQHKPLAFHPDRASLSTERNFPNPTNAFFLLTGAK